MSLAPHVQPPEPVDVMQKLGALLKWHREERQKGQSILQGGRWQMYRGEAQCKSQRRKMPLVMQRLQHSGLWYLQGLKRPANRQSKCWGYGDRVGGER